MGATGSEALGSGLAHDASLPLGWSVVERPPAGAALAQIQESNAELLRVIAALDQHAPELAEEDPSVTLELRRLEFKLNVLLDLVGSLYEREARVPPASSVRLTAHTIEWHATDAVPAGAELRLEIYLNRHYPRPLVLFGRAERATPADGGYRIDAALHPPGEAVQEWLEKIIFRHHRRHIAHARTTQR